MKLLLGICENEFNSWVSLSSFLIMAYSKEEHFQFFWLNKGSLSKLWAVAESFQEDFVVKFGAVARPPSSFRSECIKSAVDIASSAKKPIGIMMSGGIDSEIIALSMIETGVKPACISIVFEEDLNLHDISYAEKFCRRYDLSHLKIEINLREFLKKNGELEGFFHRERVLFSHRPLIMKAIQKLPDFHYIIGDGDIMLKREKINNKKELCLVKEPSFTPIFRFLENSNYEGTPRFFSYSPEQLLAFLCSDLVTKYRRVLIDSDFSLKTIEEFKTFLFSIWWPELESRPKYTGYEQVEDLLSYWQKRARTINIDWHKRIIINFEKFKNALLGNEQGYFYSNTAINL